MSLANRAVLVRLSVELFPQATTDKSVTNEVNTRKKASTRAGRYVKQLFSPQSLEGLTRIISMARNVLKRDCVPWDTSGLHLIAMTKWDKFNADMDRLASEFAEAREAFIADYDKHIDAARERLGDLFDAGDYLTEEDLRLDCQFRVDYLAVPTTADIRVENDGVLAQKIAETIGRAYSGLVDHAAETLFNEVRDIHTQMETGERFRVERVERLRETIERVREYNLTADPRIDAALDLVKGQVLDRLDNYIATRTASRSKPATSAAFESTKKAAFDAANDLVALFTE